MNKRLTKISKYLTFILRHEPQSIGLKLDSEGWGSIDELITGANASGKSITIEQLHEVVKLNETQIFSVSEDGLRIRAKAIEKPASRRIHKRVRKPAETAAEKPPETAAEKPTEMPPSPWAVATSSTKRQQ